MVLKAAENLSLILVDCTKSGSNSELMSKYSVRGYPTIVFATPEGKAVGQLQGRDAQAVAMQFGQHAKKHTRTAAWAESVETAVKAAKKDTKPIILFVSDKRNPKSTVFESFFVHTGSKETLKDFALARKEVDKKDAMLKKLGLKKVSIVLLDPTAEDPLAKPYKRISAKSPAKFQKELQKALKKWKKDQAKKASADL